MKRRNVSIIIHQEKAYFPTKAFSDGLWIDVEPVYMSSLNLMELVSTIREILGKEYPIFPDLTQEEWKQWHKKRGVILKATKTRSWKQLAKTAASYSIYLVDDQLFVSMSRLDKKGRWEWDPDKEHVFSKDEPLENIVAIIISDAKSRPNLNLASINDIL